MTVYVTVPSVEIATVGMDWPAMFGPVAITLGHLRDARAAAMDDPHILLPRLKLGHLDPRFNGTADIDTDPTTYAGDLNEDGNPAFGRVGNLRLTNDGAVLLGDFIDVPDWLAAAMPSAYPSRSPEWRSDFETKGGKRYSMVITALSLLGAELPAIADLDDLKAMLAGGPAAVRAAKATAARRSPMTTAATASVDAVREQFWNDFAQDDRYWWWPREMWVDVGQIIADDDEGHLYRVPFTTDVDGNVVFADPVRGVLSFRDVPEQAAAAAQSNGPAATYASAAAARPKDRVRGAKPTKGATSMGDLSPKLLERLGLSEDATEDDALSKLDELQAEQSPEGDEPEGDEPEGEEAEAQQQQQQPIAASVEPEALRQLQEDARLGREARETQLTAERDQYVDAAVKAGKFPPARRDHYLALMTTDPEGTRAFIDGLATGVIPVDARAVAGSEHGAIASQLEAVRGSFGLKSRKES